MVFLCCFGLQWVPNFGDYHEYPCLSYFDHWVCLTHFDLIVLNHVLHMHFIGTPYAHFMHTFAHLSCFAYNSCRYLLLTCLALFTWFWDFAYVLFRTLCLLLWTNLDLIKFVFLFCVFALVSLLCVCLCRCLPLSILLPRSPQSVHAQTQKTSEALRLTWPTMTFTKRQQLSWK